MKKQFKIAMLVLMSCAMSAMVITTWNATTTTVEAASGQWKQDNNGWWYQNADGSYPVNTWQLINNEWFHFNARGYMSTGWVKSGSHWYAIDINGRLLENCLLRSGGKIYFLAAHTGEMLTNIWVEGDYFGTDGAYIPGTPASCWQKDSRGWWFRIPDGTYPKNCIYFVDEVPYRFDANGYMLSDMWYKDYQTGWRYYKDNGREAHFEWIGDYFVDTSGVMLTNMWIGPYYVDNTGLYSNRYCNHNWVKNASAQTTSKNYYQYPASDWDSDYSGKFGHSCSKCNAYMYLSTGIDLI